MSFKEGIEDGKLFFKVTEYLQIENFLEIQNDFSSPKKLLTEQD